MAMEVFKLVGRITYEGQQKVEAGLDKLGKKIEAAEQKLGSFGEKAQAVGEKTSSIGEGLTTKVALPIAAIGGLGIKMADDMEQAFGKIQAQTGATAEQSKELMGIAKSLWRDAYGENVGEAAEAVAAVTRNMEGLGQTSEDIKKITEAAFVLKDAFGYEIAESTRAAKALMTNFGVEGDKAMNLIAVGAQKGGDYSGELIDTINEYSGDFAAAGMSAEGMFNIMIQGAENGAWNLDKTADAIKEFGIRAKDNSKTSAEGFKLMGLNAEKMTADFAAGGEKAQGAFAATIAGLSAMKDPVEQNTAGVALFGTQWEDLKGSVITGMDPAKNMLGEVEGATEKAGQALYDNFGSKLTGAIRTLQDALTPIGSVLIDIIEPALAKMETKVQDLVNWFGSLTSGQQKWIVILGLVAAAIGPLLMIVGTLVSSIGAIATAISAVGLVAAGWILAIGLLIAALVLAYAKFEWFRNGVNSVFAFIAGIVKPIIADFTAFFKAKIAEIVAWWDTNGAMIMAAFKNVWSVIQVVIKAAVAIIMPIVMGFIDGIKNIISGGLKVIMGVIEFFAALFTGNWSKMFSAAGKIIMGAIQLIWGLINVGFLGRIFGLFRLFASKAGGAISGFATKIGGFFTGIVTKAKSQFTSMVDTIYLKVLYGFDKIKGAMMKPITAAVEFIKRQVAKISGFFNALKIKFPKIKLPHFSLSGKFSLAPPSVPKLNVDWYKKGGVFGGPSVIGVGEEPGVSEAVIPLKPSVLREIGEGIARQMGGIANARAAGPLVINVQVEGKTIARAIVDDIDELLARKSKKNR